MTHLLSLFTVLFLITSAAGFSQGTQVPLFFQNNTSGTLTCVAANGQIFTLTENQSREYSIVSPGKTVPVMLVTLGDGFITWLDKKNGLTVKFYVRHQSSDQNQYSITASSGYKCQLSYATISGVRVTRIELTDQSNLVPKRPMDVETSGNATLISMMRINISETGLPRNESWLKAFDFSVSVPSAFQASDRGQTSYKGVKGSFAGFRQLDPVVEWSVRLFTDNKGDSICDVFAVCKGLPNSVPVTVQFQPLRPDQWQPGLKYTGERTPPGYYYKVYAIEEEPSSPYVGQDNNFGRFALFHCEGFNWRDQFIPAEIITQNNFREKFPLRPGVLDLKNVAGRTSEVRQPLSTNSRPNSLKPSVKVPLTKNTKQ